MKTVKKFTDAMVKNLKPTGKRFEITSGDGFCLRVSAKGKKSWIYSYWFDRQSKKMLLGYYDETEKEENTTTLSEASILYANAKALKNKGIDPIEHKKQQEAADKAEKEREIQTVEWLINDFYERYILKNRNAPVQIKQQKDADIIPLLGKLNIEDVTTRQITLALEKIVDRGSPVHANKVLRTIKQMFNYAVSKGLIKHNPAIAIESKSIGGVEVPRDRCLRYEEIKALWSYLDDRTKHKIHPATIAGLKLLLLTGVRTGSLIQAEWKEIDFDNSLWIIPPEHLKLKKTEVRKPHKVHLTELVKSLFTELKKLTDSDYILPHRDDNKPVNPKLFSRVINRSRGNIEGIKENFNTHDFRTTFSTSMADIGIAPHITELALGHKLPKIMATYNKHEYLNERKAALEQWSDKIEMLVTNDNVVVLNTNG